MHSVSNSVISDDRRLVVILNLALSIYSVARIVATVVV